MNYKQAKLTAIIATLVFFALVINANVTNVIAAYGDTGAAYFHAAIGALAILLCVGFGRIKE